MNNSVVENLDREKISNRAAVGILGSVLHSFDVNPDRFTLSKSSIHRKRRNVRKEIATEIQKKFEKRNGVLVHFDGKQLVSSNRQKREMLAVVVTGNNLTEQILNCQFLENGTGRSVAELDFECLKSWDLDTFVKGKHDTTNVNSGEMNGACVILEQLLGRKLLDLPCRHHVYELVLMTAYLVIFEANTTSPDDEVFKSFRDARDSINQGNISGLDNEQLNQEERRELIKFCDEMLQKSHIRDDYEEFLQLSLMCLDPLRRFKLKLPGAVHHARWMAKAIYGLKMFLFRDKFFFEGVTVEMLQRFALFLVRIYLKGWFQAPLTLSAPRNDHKFVNALSNYDDTQLAEATLQKFQKHLWYLTEILLPSTGMRLGESGPNPSMGGAMASSCILMHFESASINIKNYTTNLQLFIVEMLTQHRST
ncbi:uncharacterized protein LOC129720087 [Wyeomyia smithii]|uniref:uncharacterized protein LOC129720087 n=1 Tax=Wyeomyia smithii TaxID=174621 RepID=UPI002467E9AE|nr:uncharacterized protein LOC129720087 [Wyeomyia smithii]